MSVFLFTFLFSFAVWQFVSLCQPDWIRPVEQPKQSEDKATGAESPADKSGKTIQPPRPTWQLGLYILALSIIFVSCLLFFSFVVFHVFHAPLGLSLRVTDAILGRNAAALVTGSLAGCLAGISFNRIFYQQANYELTSRDKVILAALAFFVVLGIGGEDLIHSLASKINKVAIPGVEVTFFDASGKLGPAANSNNAATPVSGATAEPLGLEMSDVGFYMLTNLPDIVTRDVDYITFVSNQSQQSHQYSYDVDDSHVVDSLKDAHDVSLLISAPISKCMAYIYSRNLDKTEVDEIFNEFLKNTRSVTHKDGESNYVLGNFAAFFLEKAKKVISEHKELIRSNDPEDKEFKNLDCAPFVEEICTDTNIDSLKLKLAKLLKPRGKEIEETSTDLRNIRNVVDSCHPPNKFKNELEDYLSQINYEDVLQRPYASIARASLFAQVGRYEAALKELYVWLKSNESKGPSYKWFRLRVQNTMSNFFEEWIRKLGNKTPSSLRQYHIELLDKTADELNDAFNLADFKTRKKVELKNSIEDDEFKVAPHDRDGCKMSGEDIQANIFTVFIQTKLQSAYNKLLDIGYEQSYSHEVATAIDELMRTNFSCLRLSEEDVTRLRVELLAAFARMKANDAQAVNDVRGQSSIKADLDSAIAALDLGQQMVDRISENCSTFRRKPENIDSFNEALTVNSLEETCTELKILRGTINTTLNQMSQ